MIQATIAQPCTHLHQKTPGLFYPLYTDAVTTNPYISTPQACGLAEKKHVNILYPRAIASPDEGNTQAGHYYRKGIGIFVDDLLLGYIKTKEETSFLAIRDVYAKDGRLLLAQLGIYNLEDRIMDHLPRVNYNHWIAINCEQLNVSNITRFLDIHNAEKNRIEKLLLPDFRTQLNEEMQELEEFYSKEHLEIYRL